MVGSPTVRAAVINWVTEWYETHVVYRLFGESAEDQIVPLPKYVISDLPTGYSTDGESLKLPNYSEIIYKDEIGGIIRLEYTRMVEGNALMIGTGNMMISDAMVNGCAAQLYISTDPTQSNAVVWINEQDNLQFLIDAFIERQELLHMAESVIMDYMTNK